MSHRSRSHRHRLPKLTVLHLLALSGALNVVLLLLVIYFAGQPGRESVAGSVSEADLTKTARSLERAAWVAPAEEREVVPAAVASPASSGSSSLWSVPTPSAPASESSGTTVAAPGAAATAESGAIDPAAPGNSFRTAAGVTVAVEEVLPPQEAGGVPSLVLSISPPVGGASRSTVPASGGGGNSTGSNPGAGSSSQSNTDKSGQDSTGNSDSTGSGARRPFTLEEELFRAKWGWAAFAEAQKQAFLSGTPLTLPSGSGQ